MKDKGQAKLGHHRPTQLIPSGAEVAFADSLRRLEERMSDICNMNRVHERQYRLWPQVDALPPAPPDPELVAWVKRLCERCYPQVPQVIDLNAFYFTR